MSSKLLSSKDWKNRKFHEIALVKMGQSPPSATYNNQGLGLPFYQGNKDFGLKYPNKTIFCSGPKRIAEEGEILFSVRAPIGDINIAIEKSCIGRGLSSISMRNGNNDFLYYLLKFNSNKIKSFFETDGTVFGCLTKDDLNNFDILVPENPIEQKAIAKILSDLDDKIELNNDMNKTLEEIGQALFKRWFIDFEFPDENGNPYRSSGGEMAYSKELGKEIPKGWKVGKLGDLGQIITGRTPSTRNNNFFGGSYPFMRIPDMDSVYPLKTSLTLTEEGLQNVKNAILPQNSLLVSCIGSLGLVSINKTPLVTNQNINSIIFNNNLYLYYVYFDAKFRYKNILDNLAGGSVFGTVSKSKFSNITLLIPSLDIITKFHIINNPLFNRIYFNSEQNNYLSELRDSLLPKLMSGEIRVPLEAIQ